MKPSPVNGLDRTSAPRGAIAAHLAGSILGIAWGNEKVLSTSIECVGAVTQEFVITVE